jgi:hypothetical protein
MYSSLLLNTIAADSLRTPPCESEETEEGGTLVKESPTLITPFESNAMGSQPDVLVRRGQAGW